MRHIQDVLAGCLRAVRLLHAESTFVLCVGIFYQTADVRTVPTIKWFLYTHAPKSSHDDRSMPMHSVVSMSMIYDHDHVQVPLRPSFCCSPRGTNTFIAFLTPVAMNADGLRFSW